LGQIIDRLPRARPRCVSDENGKEAASRSRTIAGNPRESTKFIKIICRQPRLGGVGGGGKARTAQTAMGKRVFDPKAPCRRISDDRRCFLLSEPRPIRGARRKGPGLSGRDRAGHNRWLDRLLQGTTQPHDSGSRCCRCQSCDLAIDEMRLRAQQRSGWRGSAANPYHGNRMIQRRCTSRSGQWRGARLLDRLHEGLDHRDAHRASTPRFEQNAQRRHMIRSYEEMMLAAMSVLGGGAGVSIATAIEQSRSRYRAALRSRPGSTAWDRHFETRLKR